jgi:hypothetical protein
VSTLTPTPACVTCAKRSWAQGYAQATEDVTREIERQMETNDLTVDLIQDPVAGALFRLLLRVLRQTQPPRAPEATGACCTALPQEEKPIIIDPKPEGPVDERRGRRYDCLRTRTRRPTRPCSPKLLPGSDPRGASR